MRLLIATHVFIWLNEAPDQISQPTLSKLRDPDNDLQLLSIQLSHIWALEGLPAYHRDPFDRLLIAQAMSTQLPIVSADSMFDRYPVQRFW